MEEKQKTSNNSRLSRQMKKEEKFSNGSHELKD